MAYFPIAVDLTDKKCLVVGGGSVAVRKVKSLANAGARVTVVSPEVDPRLESMDSVEVIRRAYEPSDLDGCTLVFAATDNRPLNASLSAECEARGIPVNVVDDPEYCSFIVPALVRRGALLIAVTSSGKSPALSKRIRREIEDAYGPEYAAFVELLGSLRGEVKDAYESQAEREAVFTRLLDCGILELLREGKTEEAGKKARSCI